MKNVLIIFMVLTGFALTAQNKEGSKKAYNRAMNENFTPEQKAELKAKKLTLSLGLNEAQQNKVKALFVEMNTNKPARMDRKQMTDQQKFEAKNAMLDRRISMKNKMKEILTPEQMTKWEEKSNHKRYKARGKRTHFKKR